MGCKSNAPRLHVVVSLFFAQHSNIYLNASCDSASPFHLAQSLSPHTRKRPSPQAPMQAGEGERGECRRMCFNHKRRWSLLTGCSLAGWCWLAGVYCILSS